MNGVVECGLEVRLPTSPEVDPRPDTHKCYTGGERSDHPVNGPPNQPQAKNTGHPRVFWSLAVIAILSLTGALGAGLGAGLAAQHKLNVSSCASITITKANDTSVTIMETSNAPATTTQSCNETTTTQPPAPPPTPFCPRANGSTYTATNKPLPTIPAQVKYSTPSTAFSFEILCSTTLHSGMFSIIDLQVISNISSLEDCVDLCALYSFQVPLDMFQANACTGVAWGHDSTLRQAGKTWPLCWLKSGVTPGQVNWDDTGYNGAVLVNT